PGRHRAGHRRRRTPVGRGPGRRGRRGRAGGRRRDLVPGSGRRGRDARPRRPGDDRRRRPVTGRVDGAAPGRVAGAGPVAAPVVRGRGVFATTVVVALVLLVVAVLLSLLVGTRVLGVAETLSGVQRTDPVAAAVIWELRLPRTVLGLVVGAALGGAGPLAQAVPRHALPEPGRPGNRS